MYIFHEVHNWDENALSWHEKPLMMQCMKLFLWYRIFMNHQMFITRHAHIEDQNDKRNDTWLYKHILCNTYFTADKTIMK